MPTYKDDKNTYFRPDDEESFPWLKALPTYSTPNYMTDDLGKKNPLPWQVYTPDEAGMTANNILGRIGAPNGLIGTQKTSGRMLRPGEEQDFQSQPNAHKAFGQDFLDNKLRGVNDIQMSGPGHTSQNLNGSNPMSAAIDAKYAKEYGRNVSRVNQAAQMGLPQELSKQYGRAAGIESQIYQNQMSNFREQYAYQQQRMQAYSQWKQAQEQAQGSFFGSILGLGGMIGGALLAGPGGALIGGAAGGAVGAGRSAAREPQM